MLEWYFFGETRRNERITANEIKEVMDTARQRRSTIREVPLSYILDILDRTGRKFADTESDFFRSVVETMNRQLGWSPEMVEEGLATISDILTYDH